MWNMNDVVSISYRGGYSFHVVFDNGTAGDVDLSDYISRGPVFTPLADKEFLKQAKIEGGTISWPNGADIAPESLYRKIAQLRQPTETL